MGEYLLVYRLSWALGRCIEVDKPRVAEMLGTTVARALVVDAKGLSEENDRHRERSACRSGNRQRRTRRLRAGSARPLINAEKCNGKVQDCRSTETRTVQG